MPCDTTACRVFSMTCRSFQAFWGPEDLGGGKWVIATSGLLLQPHKPPPWPNSAGRASQGNHKSPLTCGAPTISLQTTPPARTWWRIYRHFFAFFPRGVMPPKESLEKYLPASPIRPDPRTELPATFGHSPPPFLARSQPLLKWSFSPLFQKPDFTARTGTPLVSLQGPGVSLRYPSRRGAEKLTLAESVMGCRRRAKSVSTPPRRVFLGLGGVWTPTRLPKNPPSP
jgi:hypothetical protein